MTKRWSICFPVRVLALGVLAISLLALSPAGSAGAQADMDAPTVASGPTITSSPAKGGTYVKGESVEFSVTFSEPVTVTGEPRLRFVMGDQRRRARFARVAANGTTVVYSYTVRGSDVDVDGISVKADQLRMAHGTIVDADDNAADLTHDALADQSGHKVDGAVPTVASGPTITSSPANGDTYGAGESVEFSVTFSEPVTVTGEPRLRFVMRDQQRRARFARVAANAKTVVYSYTVRGSDGDVDVDGISVKASELRMAHGMIVDAAGNAADLTHDALADQPGHKVDGAAPTVASGPTITSSPASGDTYGAGESVEFSVTFSEPVTVTGEPRLRFVMGGIQRRARFARVAADGATVGYSYKVVARAGDVDADGISVKASQLRMAHGMIVDAAGNAADLTHDAVADQSGHKVNGPAARTATTLRAHANVGPLPPPKPTEVRVWFSPTKVIVSWDEPANLDGIDRYRVRWRWVNQEFDDARSAIVLPGTADAGRFSYESSGLIYRVEVIAEGPGGATKSEEVLVGDLENTVYDMIERLIVKPHHDTHGWVRETWAFITQPSFRITVTATQNIHFLTSMHGSPLRRVWSRRIVTDSKWTSDDHANLYVHEMAHVWAQVAGAAVAKPGPIGVALLYFDRRARAAAEKTGNKGCKAEELFADSLMALTPANTPVDAANWGGDCTGGLDAPDQAALDVVGAASRGEMPAWLHDANSDANGNLDLTRLWEDVVNFGDHRSDSPTAGMVQDMIVYHLRDSFGGYCSDHLARASYEGWTEGEGITNPWRRGNGDCKPVAPTGVQAAAGDRSLTVSWTAPAQTGVTPVSSYIVQYKASNKKKYNPKRQVTVAGDTTSVKIPKLRNGESYTVRVIAVNRMKDDNDPYATDAGWSTPSSEVSATPAAASS